MPGSAPVALTPDDGVHRYADGIIDPQRDRWIGVRESHTGGDVVNTIVDVDLTSGWRRSRARRRQRFLCVAAAFAGWAAACLAELAASRTCRGSEPSYGWPTLVPMACRPQPRMVAGGAGESVLQPEWSPDGMLHFISDRSGWWNLYCAARRRCRSAVPARGGFRAAAMGVRHVQLRIRRARSHHLHAIGRTALPAWRSSTWRRGRWLRSICRTPTMATCMRAQGEAVFRAASPTEAASIVRLDLATGTDEGAAAFVADRSRSSPAISAMPEHITFPTEGGKTAHAFYYPPTNPDFAAESGTRAPLLVKCHGGPTAFSPGVLDLRTQYWTSRGIAVLDVNYGGSTGYGRAYRDRLHGQWGVVDVDDCINAARYLVQQRQRRCGSHRHHRRQRRRLHHADGARLRNAFAGGASHYGVSDVDALARDTHKFESRYLDWLIGRYRGNERSVSRAFAAAPRRQPRRAGDLLPGRRGQGRAAQPDRGDGGGAAPQGRSGRLPAVQRRAARIPQGAEHHARPGRGAVLLRRAGVPGDLAF